MPLNLGLGRSVSVTKSIFLSGYIKYTATSKFKIILIIECFSKDSHPLIVLVTYLAILLETCSSKIFYGMGYRLIIKTCLLLKHGKVLVKLLLLSLMFTFSLNFLMDLWID